MAAGECVVESVTRTHLEDMTIRELRTLLNKQVPIRFRLADLLPSTLLRQLETSLSLSELLHTMGDVPISTSTIPYATRFSPSAVRRSAERRAAARARTVSDFIKDGVQGGTRRLRALLQAVGQKHGGSDDDEVVATASDLARQLQQQQQ